MSVLANECGHILPITSVLSTNSFLEPDRDFSNQFEFHFFIIIFFFFFKQMEFAWCIQGSLL